MGIKSRTITARCEVLKCLRKRFCDTIQAAGDPVPSHWANRGSTPASLQAARIALPSKTTLPSSITGWFCPFCLISAASSCSSTSPIIGKARHAGWQVRPLSSRTGVRLARLDLLFAVFGTVDLCPVAVAVGLGASRLGRLVGLLGLFGGFFAGRALGRRLGTALFLVVLRLRDFMMRLLVRSVEDGSPSINLEGLPFVEGHCCQTNSSGSDPSGK